MVVAKLERVTESLLERPAREVAHLLALRFLDEAASGAIRLNDPSDAEALHDFRVGMRRLRSVLGAYRNEFRGSAGKRWRRRLRAIASLTSEGRDAEVQVEWLRGEIARMRRHRRGAASVLRRLEERMDDAYAEVRGDVMQAFGRSEIKLRQRLRYLPKLDDEPPGATFAVVTGSLVRVLLRELWELTTEIQSPDDERQIHDARIVAKRLRYVLEPIQHEIKAGKRLIKSMKRLQDVLGELHDAQVMSEALIRMRRRATASVPVQGVVDAIDELARRTEVRKSDLLRRYDTQWHGNDGPPAFEALQALADELELGDESHSEQERVFELTQMPTEAKQGRQQERYYGWLPGAAIEERVMRCREGENETFSRQVSLRSNGERIEVEEAIDAVTYRRLYALTSGCRLRLRRYCLERWTFEVTAREEKVLLRVRVASDGKPIRFPDWLAPYVEREIEAGEEFRLVSLVA